MDRDKPTQLGLIENILYHLIHFHKLSSTALWTRTYTWHWCLQENMLEESIPPTPYNKMLNLMIIPEEVGKKKQNKTPKPSICNLPFPHLPRP